MGEHNSYMLLDENRMVGIGMYMNCFVRILIEYSKTTISYIIYTSD